MNIPSLEFYVESIRHLTSSVAVRRRIISAEENYRKIMCDSNIKLNKAYDKILNDLRAKQKHEKRMLAYFVAQQRDILDYYKATDELYEETL